jgi:hypothetical protein
MNTLPSRRVWSELLPLWQLARLRGGRGLCDPAFVNGQTGESASGRVFPAPAADETIKDLGSLVGRPDRWTRLFGWTTFAGLLCGLIGPYGSYIGNPASRMLFWVGLFWAGTLILWPSVALALHVAARKRIPLVLAGTGAALLACIPLAGFAAAACYLFWPVHASGIRTQEWYAHTVTLALPAAAIAFWFEWYRDQGQTRSRAIRLPGISEEEAAGPQSGPLPDRLLDLILCLQMEDHHVRYHTAAGSSLHFAPMRDVVRQMGIARGLQVHRSWWVARSAVCDATGDSRALELVLTNGLRVPVARSRVAAVRDVGWLSEATASGKRAAD